MALSIPNPLSKWSKRWPGAVVGARRNRRTSITALDLEGGWLHVVQAAVRGGQPHVVRHVATALSLREGVPPEDAVALGEAVGRALKQLKLSPGPVIMGVPRAQVMLRSLELPPTQQATEIASMVYFQVSRDLPFRLEEASLDFKVLTESADSAPPVEPPAGKAADGESAAPPPPSTKVLTAVVRRETVEYYQALADAAGLKLVALGLRSVAGAQAVGFCHREATSGCVALVSIRDSEVIFDVLRDGTLVFSRVGTMPTGLALTEADNARAVASIVEPAVLEVVRSLHSYESADGHRHVDRFFVAGATGVEAALAAALERRFGVPGQVLDPSVALAEAEGDKAHVASALPAIGLALGALDAAGLSFDLLNPKRPPVKRDYRRVRVLGSVAGAMVLIMAVAGLRAHWLHQREQQRNAIRDQLNQANQSLKAFRMVRAQALALRTWDAGNRNWLDHLALLSALLPRSHDLYVTALSTSARNTLRLGVRVRRGDIIDRLSSTLRAAGYQVRPPAITPVSDRYGYRFQANLELTVPVKITNDLDHLKIEKRPPPSPQTRRALATHAAAATASAKPKAKAKPRPTPEKKSEARPRSRRRRARPPYLHRRPGAGFQRGRYRRSRGEGGGARG